ncbi:hypothetical protein V6Z11_D09G006600 [Gossypium hirsutum]
MDRTQFHRWRGTENVRRRLLSDRCSKSSCDAKERACLLSITGKQIQVKSNVDPIFYLLVGSRQSRGTTTTPLFSIVYTSLISVWTAIFRAQGDGGIVPFKPFFSCFSQRLKKAAINRIFLILPSRKEEPVRMLGC